MQQLLLIEATQKKKASAIIITNNNVRGSFDTRYSITPTGTRRSHREPRKKGGKSEKDKDRKDRPMGRQTKTDRTTGGRTDGMTDQPTDVQTDGHIEATGDRTDNKNAALPCCCNTIQI